MSSPRPVLLLVRELGVGGCERDLCKLAMHLDRRRYLPLVGAFHAQGIRATELRAAGVPVTEFPVRSFKSFSLFPAAIALRRFIRHHRIALLHTFDLPANVWTALAGRALGGPPLIMCQFWERRKLPAGSIRMLRATDRFADAMVANSEATRRELIDEEHLPAEKIRTIHNGLDTKLFMPAAPGQSRPPELAGPGLVIGTVCALREEKRLDILMRAFAKLNAPEARLVIVGSGQMLPALQQLQRDLALGDRCVFVPLVHNVVPWLQALDIFVLSSETESFPNALLEAMACGCAVIGSRVGGVPELIEDGESGLLFPANDIDALAAQLSRLAADPELRQRFRQRAATRARQEFSMEKNAERTQALYDAVLAERGH